MVAKLGDESNIFVVLGYLTARWTSLWIELSLKNNNWLLAAELSF